MKVPLSWIKDFIKIEMPVPDLAARLTMAGLEVEEIRYVGLPLPPSGGRQEIKITGLAWDPEKIVVGEIREVAPHPNADRLVLCRLFDGRQEHTVLTGAPNLFEYKGQGPLAQPIKVAYAREGAELYDGHQPGQTLMTLKRAKIRGVESYSMACSEKELGISDEHEGIIFLDAGAPTGMPLVEYMGDVVLDIAITPNIARDANMLGVAREISALTGTPLREHNLEPVMAGSPIAGRAFVEIKEPPLNPRFVLGLIEGIEIKPSPYEVQRRLRLAGMRPINNIVDATNYAMLEIGEPLHAFDYDALVQRAGGEPPTIITRTAKPNERLTTLDDIERKLDDFTVLVCDQTGPLSIAGVMGGEETEVNAETRRVLLEGAAWNFINIRRTLSAQRMASEAAYRFSRGVHPALASVGVMRGLELMRQWAGGVIAEGLVDEYPLPPAPVMVDFTTADVRRWLGITLNVDEIRTILERLAFLVTQDGEVIRAVVPDFRLDIGTGIVGVADIMEEIARIYGYDRIPQTRLADALPPQRRTVKLEQEERLRDMLVNLGLQEVITYRMSAPEREARLLPPGGAEEERQYVRLANPISADKTALRRSLLNSLLEVVERNARVQERLALFEIGPVFLPSQGGGLPDE
ncbi:MAG TPA: phenylalanine--tRNA ligase subunit beta, partial [Anaerolineales bacterium]|nr:phenylalanine--tRNA ligase subunit beta [Anaerolineales bacterium]